jgi:Zn-dependent peptidase ImmA (M78 family)
MHDMQKRVRDLLHRNRVLGPPVPVQRIAERLGLQVRFAPLNGDVSGAILRSGSETVVGVNSFHHPNRQRFTIGHEIAHFLLHEGLSMHIDRQFRINLRDQESSKALDSEEIQANRFAAELLMPVDFLVKDLAAVADINDETISRLARRYRVSSQAMQIRLANLGFVDPL